MTVTFREARREDVPAVVALLKDDILGDEREATDPTPYVEAFDAMRREGYNRLIVGEIGGRVVAAYQIVVMSGLSLRAARRAQIEGVRVAEDRRGQGIGAALMADAEERARAAGATLMQFTSNKARSRAHGFYARAGYAASHEGFKKPI